MANKIKTISAGDALTQSPRVDRGRAGDANRRPGRACDSSTAADAMPERQHPTSCYGRTAFGFALEALGRDRPVH
jgi:hypothetical protein